MNFVKYFIKYSLGVARRCAAARSQEGVKEAEHLRVILLQVSEVFTEKGLCNPISIPFLYPHSVILPDDIFLKKLNFIACLTKDLRNILK